MGVPDILISWASLISAKSGDGLQLALFVHHTDADREYAYERNSHVGTLDKVLDIADKHDWIIVDMKRDWKVVFPFEKK
jgi:hypothetical protein